MGSRSCSGAALELLWSSELQPQRCRPALPLRFSTHGGDLAGLCHSKSLHHILQTCEGQSTGSPAVAGLEHTSDSQR